MINWILWLVLGALAGYLARVLLKRTAGKWWQNVLIGALGAMLGGYLSMALGLGPVTGLNLYSLLVAVFGAALLTLLIDIVRGKIG